MSEMYKQAIIDAEKLKEVAIKAVENQIVEKYNKTIVEAVDKFITEGDSLKDLPLNGSEEILKDPCQKCGQKDCQCPSQEEESEEENEQEITINIESLKEEIDHLLEECGNMEGLSSMVDSPPEDSEKVQIDININVNDDDNDEDEEEAFHSDDIVSQPDFSEEEIYQSIAEELNFDFEVVPTGHIGAFTEQEREYAIEINKVKEIAKKAQEDLSCLQEKYDKLLGIAKTLKEELKQSNLKNAKLLYSSKVFENGSMNERQKSVFVQKISEARTTQEAKLIFEAISEVINQEPKKRQQKSPESLSEAIRNKNGRVSQLREGRKAGKAEQHSPEKLRMQELAGIIKG